MEVNRTNCAFCPLSALMEREGDWRNASPEDVQQSIEKMNRICNHAQQLITDTTGDDLNGKLYGMD